MKGEKETRFVHVYSVFAKWDRPNQKFLVLLLFEDIFVLFLPLPLRISILGHYLGLNLQ